MARKGLRKQNCLVAIAIIVVMVTMLFPVFTRARERPGPAKCLNRLCPSDIGRPALPIVDKPGGVGMLPSSFFFHTA